jgi:hypothetical protein
VNNREENSMKKFLAIYLGSASNLAKWKAMDEGERKRREKAGMDAWSQWASTNQKAIVDQGSPLGKTKRASAQGISDTKNEMAAYTVVQAESHDAAVRMFEEHPHFTLFPGDSVEVMECLPMPEM